jgi:hypothetical protein
MGKAWLFCYTCTCGWIKQFLNKAQFELNKKNFCKTQKCLRTPSLCLLLRWLAHLVLHCTNKAQFNQNSYMYLQLHFRHLFLNIHDMYVSPYAHNALSATCICYCYLFIECTDDDTGGVKETTAWFRASKHWQIYIYIHYMCVHILQRALDSLIEIIPDMSRIDDDFKVSYMYYTHVHVHESSGLA